MANIIFDHLCPLFNKDYLLNYFLRFWIHAALQFLYRKLILESIKIKYKINYIKSFVNVMLC